MKLKKTCKGFIQLVWRYPGVKMRCVRTLLVSNHSEDIFHLSRLQFLQLFRRMLQHYSAVKLHLTFIRMKGG